MDMKDLEIVIVSGFDDRDGLGIEIWENNKLIIEVFRNDLKKVKEITTYKKDISLDVIEYAIDVFKKEISSEFD